MKSHVLLAFVLVASPLLCAQEDRARAQPTDPETFLKMMAPYYDYASSDMKPWHVRYSYRYYDQNGQPSAQGQFEYWWAKGKATKAAWTHGDQSELEWHTTEAKELRLGTGKRIEGMEQRLYSALLPYFLKMIDSPSDTQLRSFTSQYESKQLACVGKPRPASGTNGDSLEIDWPSYCFDEHEPILVASHENGTIINTYDHVQKFQNHNIPGEIRVFYAGKKRVDAKLEDLSEIAAEDVDFTPSPDAREPQTIVSTVPAISVTPLVLTERVEPIYPPGARATHIAGTVVIDATIGKDGRIKDAQVTSSPDASLSSAALDAVRQWRYRPYAVNGQPTETHTTINLNFVP